MALRRFLLFLPPAARLARLTIVFAAVAALELPRPSLTQSVSSPTGRVKC